MFLSPYFGINNFLIKSLIVTSVLSGIFVVNKMFLSSVNISKKKKKEIEKEIETYNLLINKLEEQIKKEKEKLDEACVRLEELKKDIKLEEITTDEIIHLDTQNNSKDIFEELYQQSLEETQKNNLTNPKTRRRIRNDKRHN